MSPTRQDVQAIVEAAKNRVLERVAQKQDIQVLTDCIKTLLNVQQQNQQLLRQAEAQRVQLINRAITLETRLSQLEREMQNCKNLIRQPQQQRIVIPLPNDYAGNGQRREYVYQTG